MISFANAGANPRTMMIHSLDADPALVTMTCPVWSKNVASCAEF
jgi:hypothetical protein